MTKIYIPQHNFSLEKNPELLERTKGENIGRFTYKNKIEPKLNLIAGTYNVQNTETDLSHIIPYKFVVSEFDIKEASEFALGNRSALEVQIQDSKSYFIENCDFLGRFIDSTYLPKKRTGTITIDKSVCANTIIKCTLDDVVEITKLRSI